MKNPWMQAHDPNFMFNYYFKMSNNVCDWKHITSHIIYKIYSDEDWMVEYISD